MDSKLGNLKLYDEIVGTVVANVLAESTRTDNKIYLKWFESDQASHNVYFEGASIAAAVLKTQIYMDMPLHKYILFKFKNWRRRKLLKWVRTKKVPESATQIQLIINHISTHFELTPETGAIWRDINYRYYTKKKGATDESNCN